MLSCLVVSYTQRPSDFKAIIKSIFKTNLPSLPSLPPILSPFLSEKASEIYKILQKCEQKWNIFARNLSIIKSRNVCYFAVVMQESSHRSEESSHRSKVRFMYMPNSHVFKTKLVLFSVHFPKICLLRIWEISCGLCANRASPQL
jgi:hypothetical protein